MFGDITKKVHNMELSLVIAYLIGCLVFSYVTFRTPKLQPLKYKFSILKSLSSIVNLYIQVIVGKFFWNFLCLDLKDRIIIDQLTVYFVYLDTMYYWFHRLLHNPLLFKWIHQFHHKSTAPNIFEVLCGNPIEDIFAMSLMFVPCIFKLVSGTHVAIAMIVISLSSLATHTGLDFYFVKHHDDHHKYVGVNFGQLSSFWDRLMMTNHK
jgi:sterol desaturase/sphingolipid hydroxylase (fatty acid hydroxylase superfamily)